MAEEEGKMSAVMAACQLKQVFSLVVLYSFEGGTETVFHNLGVVRSSKANSWERLLSGDLLLPETELITMGSS